jgi:excisionase family DNA binding protein
MHCDGAFTINQFCEHYGVGRTFLYEQIKSGHLAARKAGTRTLILRAEAERWACALPKLDTATAD